MFLSVRFCRVLDGFDTTDGDPLHFVEAVRVVTTGEVFGVPAVSMKALVVALGSVLSRTSQVRVDRLLDERAVNTANRLNRMS